MHSFSCTRPSVPLRTRHREIRQRRRLIRPNPPHPRPPLRLKGGGDVLTAPFVVSGTLIPVVGSHLKALDAALNAYVATGCAFRCGFEARRRSFTASLSVTKAPTRSPPPMTISRRTFTSTVSATASIVTISDSTSTEGPSKTDTALGISMSTSRRSLSQSHSRRSVSGSLSRSVTWWRPSWHRMSATQSMRLVTLNCRPFSVSYGLVRGGSDCQRHRCVTSGTQLDHRRGAATSRCGGGAQAVRWKSRLDRKSS